ncbi:MAG: 16S rRNA (guanine(966)-N(2))-methyltransferase RsmD [Bauldia sp.]|nr:16S rRNA (guanine(966)-N(2))-methyltransferase RsmD [Bauldia sp.]
MRIVAGEFRGRPLAGPTTSAIRPTSDRLRETVFDILAHGLGDPVTGARVLDLFAGTGALALEALSRGAASALLVEEAVEARGLIRRNVEALGLTGRAKIFRRDATRLGDAGTLGPFSVVFADPPYGKGLGEAALASAAGGGWLAQGAIAILEEAATSDVTVPAGFTLLDARKVGDSQVRFLAFGEAA